MMLMMMTGRDLLPRKRPSWSGCRQRPRESSWRRCSNGVRIGGQRSGSCVLGVGETSSGMVNQAAPYLIGLAARWSAIGMVSGPLAQGKCAGR